ncbi:hypothetical protein CSB45_07395 [candidate division KSB3 bacterium]|uniref:VOC domain-containing protein n=1 Tax=candidate division KSB3 bacterium TaxID=2044937 RepID=A0A2G6E5T3_9BACT|nr:MAG: hypothetical protein CSB45_07395 [candidate division KSB3 bacterium]PIE29956.1 MAG: hypothetical protein CSA57_06100 [candidate division KSB3 bacterium]
MKITHVAIWTEQLERLKDFYVRYFKATAGEKYVNPDKGFASYFMTFQGETTLELMSSTNLHARAEDKSVYVVGLAHLAFGLEDEKAVDEQIRRLQQDGYALISAPRRTGDGYYESAVLDPDGNIIEITC